MGREYRLRTAPVFDEHTSLNLGCSMRITVLAALLFFSSTGLCKSDAPRPAMPEQQVPPPITNQPFNGSAREFHLNPDLPLGAKMLQQPDRGSAPKIDPLMVLRPPRASVGQQAPGTMVAQNLYPGLQLTPIDQPHAAKPTPVAWPELQIKNIPTQWLKLTVVPVGMDAKPAAK
jgi:hypothetical protein